MMQRNESRNIRGIAGSIGVALCMLLIASLFVAPASYAQCTAASTATMTGVSNTVVFRILSMLTAANADAACNNGAAVGVGVVCGEQGAAPVLVAVGASMNLPDARSCAWVCNTTGGTCSPVITNTHGLPVELMDFSISENGEDSAGGEDQESQTED